MKTGMEYKQEILAAIEERKIAKAVVFEKKVWFAMKVMGFVTIAFGFGVLIAGLIKR